ncbi:HAD family phosphatase [Streptomyces sp. NBC_01808]|uniref:HAD family hydrolase n=1 Tax=Streptomyces sp. NBC_01808 TaxID=2975947 RepID=UPI002DD9B4C9|nr:HAD family phosphatase [Streptomyces sp. NBC_01808]WSA39548.1 HAD family phosphatase [Streptomyces sp. NBC_01808]
MHAAFPSLPDWSPDAVVFDCDGTLVDNESHWQDARVRAFLEFGLRIPSGFAERAKGVHYADCGQMMAQAVGKPELSADLTSVLLTQFMSLATHDPVTMPGATELVEVLSGRLPLAVASNCPLEVVEMSLEIAGLRPHFRHVVVPTPAPGGTEGADTAGEHDRQPVRPKPYPDVYAEAARLCGAPPHLTLAVEDSATGVESARAAGLRVLGVGARPFGGKPLQADLWLPSLDSPQLLAWAAGMAESRAAPKRWEGGHP